MAVSGERPLLDSEAPSGCSALEAIRSACRHSWAPSSTWAGADSPTRPQLLQLPSGAFSVAARSPTPSREEQLEGDLLEILELLHRADAFRDLPDEELPALARAFQTRRAESGEVIIEEGDVDEELFFIQSGTVSVRTSSGAGKRQRRVAELSPGEYFAGQGCLTDVPQDVTVVAEDAVLLRVLSKQTLEGFDLKRRLHLERSQIQLGNGLGTLVRSASFVSLGKFLLVLSTYLAFSVLVFSNLEGWNWQDCVYFAVITLSTVGYGDLVPKNWATRLFIVVFILVALVFVARAVGEFLEALVSLELRNEKARRALLMRQRPRNHVCIGVSKRHRWRKKFVSSLAGILVLLVLGSILARYTVEDCDDWINALYFVTVTITTIGYGDIFPHEQYGRWATAVFALIGVPLFGMALARTCEVAYGTARASSMSTVVGGLTNEKFDQLIDFTDTLWRKGAYNSKPQESRREEITPFEFLCFILTKNEIMSVAEIKAVMSNFTELDVIQSGKLEQRDVDEWLRRGSRNPHGLDCALSASSRKIRRQQTGSSASPSVNRDRGCSTTSQDTMTSAAAPSSCPVSRYNSATVREDEAS